MNAYGNTENISQVRTATAVNPEKVFVAFTGKEAGCVFQCPFLGIEFLLLI
jgi:hypothetical protein